ncbi:hypothetical protein AGDE_13886 [Angomonas deanei]|nr:hypothetical protein AGDE_13886 [Angomonas deanei]|eukprot:EPY21668.1 hypothetical protein AGDE_13886 [Angomonas deanei]
MRHRRQVNIDGGAEQLGEVPCMRGETSEQHPVYRYARAHLTRHERVVGVPHHEQIHPQSLLGPYNQPPLLLREVGGVHGRLRHGATEKGPLCVDALLHPFHQLEHILRHIDLSLWGIKITQQTEAGLSIEAQRDVEPDAHF